MNTSTSTETRLARQEATLRRLVATIVDADTWDESIYNCRPDDDWILVHRDSWTALQQAADEIDAWRPWQNAEGAYKPGNPVTALTHQVIASLSSTPNPRLREVISSVVRHVHALTRENHITSAEWAIAIDFLTAVGHKCDDSRQEFVLLSDVLGISSLVEALTGRDVEGTTPSTILGPFHMVNSPPRTLGANLYPDRGIASPHRAVVVGTVTAADGSPVVGARVDVWQADARGMYDVQDPQRRADGDGRGLFETDRQGRFWFRTETPTAYPVPADGPVGHLLARTGRHGYRPAHMHFIVNAPGYQSLTTHIFVAGSPYLNSDVVFAVDPSLITEFREVDDATVADRYLSTAPFRLAQFNIVLQQDISQGEGHG